MRVVILLSQTEIIKGWRFWGSDGGAERGRLGMFNIEMAKVG